MKTKKILALCLCLVMLFQLVIPMTVQAAPTTGTFGVDSNGTKGALTWKYEAPRLIISLTDGFTDGAMDDYTDGNDASGKPLAYKEIPWISYRGSIQTIDIQEGVTAIGARAFTHHTYTYAINLPSTIEKIGTRAFYQCRRLEELTFVEGLKEVGEGAFQECPVLSIISLPKSLETVKYAAFSGTASLTTIYYGGSQAEWDAISVASSNGQLDKAAITYDAVGGAIYNWDETTGVLTISGHGQTLSYTGHKYSPLYSYRSKIKEVIIEEGITAIGSYLFGYAKMTKISLPRSLRMVGFNAFYKCDQLQEVKFPSTTKRIFNNAFYGCTALTKIALPGDLVELQHSVVNGCTALTDIEFNGTEIQYKTFLYGGPEDTNGYMRTAEDASGNTYYVNEKCHKNNTTITNAILNNQVKILVEGCKETFDGVDTITITTGMDEYGQYMSMENFTNERLPSWSQYQNVAKKVIIADNVPNIGDYAFYKFAKMESIEIADSVTDIGGRAFYNCSKLTEITLPRNLKTMGQWVFNGCKALTTIYIPKTLQKVETGVFRGLPTTFTDIYFEGTEAEWLAVNGMKTAVGYLPAGVTIHYGYEYPAPEEPEEPVATGWEYADGVLTVKENIADFAEGAAPWNKYADEITSVVIADVVTALPTYAFSGLNIASVVIPEDVTVIPEGAFKGCTALTNATVPAGITAVGADALAGCTALTTLYFDGTEEEFANISIAAGNDVLETAEIVFTGKPGGGIELPDFDF